MSKKNRERREDERPASAGASARSSGAAAPSWVPTVLSVAALAFSVFLWMDSKRAADGLKKVEEKVTVLTTQLASVQANRQAPPPQRGPDPAKVYPVNIQGAPTKGNPNAPIVIAEFSEFQ